jgi:hypothetical protein
MKFNFNYLLFCFFAFLLAQTVDAQTIRDTVFSKKIKTIQIYKEGWEMSPAIIELDSPEKLILSFDDLNNKAENYCYTLIHCNSDWESSNLTYSEYANGFEQNQIRSPLFSTNTMVNYIHYSVSIPNDDCQPRISGNYILKVFSDFDTSRIVFIKRFYVTERTATVKLDIMRPEIPKYMMKYQQFKLYVRPNVNDFTDLKSEVKTFIIQNFNSTSIKKCYAPRLEENTLIYDDQDSNIFEAGNEFRNFDIKSVRYQSARIQSSTFAGDSRSIELYPDEWRYKKMYFSDIDINGKFYIENSLGVKKEIDADYNKVRIYLPTKEPVIDGGIYVLGALTNWQCNSLSLMKYNFNIHSYELELLVKQGYYNYQFAFKDGFSDKVDFAYIEGNHYETENDYCAFIYYKPATARYERLIGVQMANSIKK